MLNQYKYFVTIGLTVKKQVFPINVRALNQEYAESTEDNRFGFIETLAPEIEFRGDDFTFLNGIETSGQRCVPIKLEIEVLCGDGYIPWRTGELRMVNGDFDLDKCIVKIKPTILNDYSCFDQWAEVETNMFDAVVPRRTAQWLRGVIEYFSYTTNLDEPDDPAQFGGFTPASLGWRMYKHEYFTTTPNHRYYYAREKLTLPVGTPPGTGWVFLQNVGANDEWVRLPVLCDQVPLNVNNETPAVGNAPRRYFGNTPLFATNILGDQLPGSFDNGIHYNDLLQWYLVNYCDLALESIFLQAGSGGDFATTYPTLIDEITYHHLLFQKSDVKRPGDQNNATKAIVTLKKLLVNICNMYNLRWRIAAGVLRIEHVSYFTRTQTLDTTIGEAKTRVIFTRRYKYQTEKIPRYETFKFMEKGSADFEGRKIEYVGDCVSEDRQNKSKDVNIEEFTTDVESCLLNSAYDSKIISDQGFVIMAAQLNLVDNKYYLFAVDPTIEPYMHPNNSLGWAFLHKTYFLHDRLQLNGYINGSYGSFLSTRPNKKRTRIAIRFCCDDSIDLTGTVLTDMGEAVIGAAQFDMYQNQLNLDLVYSDTIGNYACLRPKRFAYQLYDSTTKLWWFDTAFEIPGSYFTEIEATRPDMIKEYYQINPDVDGLAPAAFTDMVGLWSFRKRIICAGGYIGPWTEFQKVNIDAVTGGVTGSCLNIAEPVVFLQRGAKPQFFIFRIAEALSYPNYPIQCEVTRPATPPYLVNNLGGTFVGTYHDVVVDINDAAPYNVNSPVPAGLYQFRFRRVCDASLGKYSDWSVIVNVNI